MTITIILTLIMCALLFLMIWAAAYFYPWERLLEFFPEDIEENWSDDDEMFLFRKIITKK